MWTGCQIRRESDRSGDAGQVDLVLADGERRSGAVESKGDELRAIEPRGVTVIVVMVEKRSPFVSLVSHFRCPRGGCAVRMAHDDASGCPVVCIENVDGIELYAIGIAVEVRLARDGMHHHRCSLMESNDANVRVWAAPVEHYDSLSDGARAAAEHHIALLPCHLCRHVATRRLRSGARCPDAGEPHEGEEGGDGVFHSVCRLGFAGNVGEKIEMGK